MPTAVINMADQGPVESLIKMLTTIGYTCFYPSQSLRDELRKIGCDTVLEQKHLVDSMGYEYPLALAQMSINELVQYGSDVVFIDVKAHRNYPKIVSSFPGLENRVLWMRINGGKPEHVITADGFDCGDEINPPCPVLTPNQWYKEPVLETTTIHNKVWATHVPGLGNRAYPHWPPFYRFNDYYNKLGRSPQYSPSYGNEIDYYTLTGFESPCCLIHRIEGWGYGKLVAPLREIGVKFYGTGSPDGLINHRAVPSLLSRSLCMIHLKSNDAPGYALYEAMAAGCPIICSRRLIWRCKMQELLIPGETCLVFDRETHDSLSDTDVTKCMEEIDNHLDTLCNPAENHRIGLNAYKRLQEVMWSDANPEDVSSFRKFMTTHFGE